MNYELAKKLKVEGFPQEEADWGIVYLPEKVSISNNGVKWRRKEQYKVFPWHRFGGFLTGGYEPIVYPTLSELLESCGEKFENLERFIWDGDVIWRAYMTDAAFEIYSKKYPCVKECCGYGSGGTAEEALADLWLSLQSKSK